MADLVIREETMLALATVMARRNVDLGTISAALGIAMPLGPRAAWIDGLTALGTGPGTWLMVDGRHAAGFVPTLSNRLFGLASVSDQSSGYAVFRIGGTDARRFLQRGAYIDFHPSVFGPENCAVTVIAHVGVVIWQAAEAPDFRVAVFRSYRTSFRHWLDTNLATL